MFFIVFIAVFLLLPTTNASAHVWRNDQTIFGHHSYVLSGGLVFPKSYPGLFDGKNISVYNSGTQYQIFFTSANPFCAGTLTATSARSNDLCMKIIDLADSINGFDWKTNLTIIGGNGLAATTLYATGSTIATATLTSVHENSSFSEIGTDSYLSVDAPRNNKVK
jgi:hypothetical protein